jgi:AcrR family transcriptional regulator
VEQIARAGMAIADKEGMGGLSMQRLAEQLGVGTMTLYSYVPDKASLLEVMLDLVVMDLTPQGRREGWRCYLEDTARALMQAYRQHPWALQISVGGPPLGPGQSQFLEAALQSLAETNLEDEERLDAVMAVSSFVRGVAHISVGMTAAEQVSGVTDEEIQATYTEAYRRVLDPDRFPMTHQLLSTEPDESESQEPYDFGFTFGLDRLLDGIEQLIATRSRTA